MYKNIAKTLFVLLLVLKVSACGNRQNKAVEPTEDLTAKHDLQGIWLDVGLISGIGAKEIVASSMGILYHNDDVVEEGSEESYSNLRKQMVADGITPLSSYCFLLFVLLYFPCIATIAAIKGETGSWKWASFAAVYTTALAWIVSAVVYQIGTMLGL